MRRQLVVKPVLRDGGSSSHLVSRHLLSHYSLHSISLELATEIVEQVVHVSLILFLLISLLMLVSHEVYERVLFSICVKDCLSLQKVYRSEPPVSI